MNETKRAQVQLSRYEYVHILGLSVCPFVRIYMRMQINTRDLIIDG